MIINKIRLQELTPMTRGTDVWALPFCDLNLDSSAGNNGYLVKDVVGIDPPDLEAIIDGFDRFGQPIFGNYSKGREVSIRIELTPIGTQTASYLRDALYRYVSRGIKLSFMYDGLVQATWICAIKNIEAIHFSNKPEIKLVLTSKYATFSAPNKIDIPAATLATANPIINYNEGTAPAELYISFQVINLGGVSNFRIYNHSKEWYDTTATLNTNFEVTRAFVYGDIAKITSGPETKSVTLTRALVTTDLEGYLNAFAAWPKLISGVNTFDWTFNTNWIFYEAYYTPRFWGV